MKLVHSSFGSGVPALQASIPFFACNHALTRVAPQKQVTVPVFRGAGRLLTAGTRRPLLLPIWSKHRAANHFQTSLEEAAVNRPRPFSMSALRFG